jgi:membrane protease YdiL (CAAX protease family)
LLVAGAVLGVSLHGLTDLIQFAVERVFPTPEAVLEAQVERLAKGGAVERAVVSLFVCLLAPFVEELFFRGALHARLAPGRKAVPVGITTAACFTLSHAEPRIWPSLLLIGLALAVLRRASESLVPCYLLHAAFNATTLIFVWSDPNPSNQSSPSVYVVCGAGGVAIALLAWVSQRARAEASR